MPTIVREDTNFIITIVVLALCGAGIFVLATHNKAVELQDGAAKDPQAPKPVITEGHHSECEGVVVAEHEQYTMTIAYITTSAQVEPALCLLHDGWKPLGSIKAGSPPFPTLGFFKPQTGEKWLH